MCCVGARPSALLRSAQVLYCIPRHAPGGAAASLAHQAALRLLSSLRSAVLRALLAACSVLAWLEGHQAFLEQLCLCAWAADSLRLGTSVQGILAAAAVGLVMEFGAKGSIPLALSPEVMQTFMGRFVHIRAVGAVGHSVHVMGWHAPPNHLPFLLLQASTCSPAGQRWPRRSTKRRRMCWPAYSLRWLNAAGPSGCSSMQQRRSVPD